MISIVLYALLGVVLVVGGIDPLNKPLHYIVILAIVAAIDFNSWREN